MFATSINSLEQFTTSNDENLKTKNEKNKKNETNETNNKIDNVSLLNDNLFANQISIGNERKRKRTLENFLDFESSRKIYASHFKVFDNLDYLNIYKDIDIESNYKHVPDLRNETIVNAQGLNFHSSCYESQKTNSSDKLNTNMMKNLENTLSEFREILSIDPSNITIWMNYFQALENYYCDLGVPISTRSKKILSVVYDAIKKNPFDTKLLCILLQLSEDVFDWKYLNSIWDKIFLQGRNLIVPELWITYLNFLKGNLKFFTIDILRDAYSRALRSLSLENLKSPNEFLESFILDILFSYTIFEKESGYMERAISVLQANIEYNSLSVFPNSGILQSTPNSLKKQEFKQFWNQEFPRIGEDGACGWGHWKNMSVEQQYQRISQIENLKFIENREESKNILNSQLENFNGQLWIDEEFEKDNSLNFTNQKSSSEISESSIYTYIFFDDIEPFIIEASSNSFRIKLIYTLLQLCGYYRLNFNSLNSKLNPFINFFNSQEDISNILDLHLSSLDIDKENSIWDWMSLNLKNNQFLSMIENILKLSIEYYPDNYEFTDHFIRVLYCRGVDVAIEFCEKLLYKQRNNITLWTNYADLCFKNNKSDYKKIYNTSLSSITRSDSKLNNINSITKLFISYFEKEIITKNENLAIHILLSYIEYIGEGKEFIDIEINLNQDKNNLENIARFNKIKSLFKIIPDKGPFIIYSMSILHHLIDNNELIGKKLFEENLLKLKYEKSHYKNINSREIIPRLLKSYQSSAQIEIYNQLFYLYLKYIFCISNKIKEDPNNLNFILENLIFNLPDNSELFCIFFNKNIMENNKLRILNFIIEHNCLFIPHIFIIISLIKEGNTIIIRNLIEKALKSEQGRYFILLWRLYIRFEMQYGTKDSIHKICIRALQNCPFSKRIWLDSYIHLNDESNSVDIQNLMFEKGIKLWKFKI